MRKIFNRKILRFLSTRKIFDPQFIPLPSTLIFIRRTNEMAFQFRYFSHPIPDTTSKLFNLAKWLLDMAVRSNRFHNWRQFIRGFSLSLSIQPSRVSFLFNPRERRFLSVVYLLLLFWQSRSNYAKRTGGQSEIKRRTRVKIVRGNDCRNTCVQK